MDSQQLPIEIWMYIASITSRSAALALALASSFHLSAVRLVVYKSLLLWIYEDTAAKKYRRRHDASRATLQMLSKTAPLAGCVQTLILKGTFELSRGSDDEPCTKPPMHTFSLLLDVLPYMPNISRLVIRSSWPENETPTHLKFVNLLQTYCKELRDIELRRVEFFSNPLYLPLTGVRRVRLENKKGSPVKVFSSHILRSLLVASANTITHLILPSQDGSIELSKFIPYSLSVRHPLLETLVLGGWPSSYSDKVKIALVRFLSMHPTIKRLQLGWNVDSSGAIGYADVKWEVNGDTSEQNDSPPPLELEPLTQGFLPNLVSLRAYAPTLRTLARRCPDVIKNLDELQIGLSTKGRSRKQLTDTLKALDQVGGAPGLKTLWHNHHKSHRRALAPFLENMSGYAATFPELEVWIGGIPDTVGLSELITMFTKFPLLREIHIHNQWAEHHMVTSFVDIARVLAAHCPSLEVFSTAMKYRTANIARNANGRSVAVHSTINTWIEDEDGWW